MCKQHKILKKEPLGKRPELAFAHVDGDDEDKRDDVETDLEPNKVSKTCEQYMDGSCPYKIKHT